MANALSLANLQTAMAQNNTKIKEWVGNQINNVKVVTITWVETLPIENISTSTIYMVKSEKTEGNNIYDEYAYNSTTSTWELLGQVDTGSIDLSNYYNKTETYTKTEVDNLFANNYSDEEITQMITTIWSE